MSNNKAARLPATDESSDQDKQWSAWQPASLLVGTSPSTRTMTQAQDQAVTQGIKDEIEKIKTQAKTAAYQEGHQKGLNEGRSLGLQQGLEQGTQEGYAKGYEEGRALATKEAEQLANLAQAGAQALTRLETELGQSLVGLALRIAEHIVHDRLEHYPAQIEALIGDLVRLAGEQNTALQLYVHPDDLALVSAYLETSPHTNHWQALADPSITQGGCLARSALGDIDATLETRWRRIRASLGYDQ